MGCPCGEAGRHLPELLSGVAPAQNEAAELLPARDDGLAANAEEHHDDRVRVHIVKGRREVPPEDLALCT